jgi:hypothetical protein
MMELIKVWYSDENALARLKMYTQMVAHVQPLFVEIIRQGAGEGVFTTPYPEHASQVLIGLSQTLGDTFARLLLTEEKSSGQALQEAEIFVAAYQDVVERILGAPHGSIRLMDVESLEEWFSPKDSPDRSPLDESAIPGSQKA